MKLTNLVKPQRNLTWLCRGVWAIHLLGMGLTARLTHQPLWLVVFLLLILRPLVLVFRPRETVCRAVSPLRPLLLVYAAAGLRILIMLVVRFNDPTAAVSVPPPWGTWLDLNRIMLVCLVWVLFLETRPAWRGHFVLLAALLWAGVTYFSLATHGVTAIDPYGYVQMAVDLAERGTALHTFDLAPLAAAWGLPLYPTVPLGFTFPDPLTGVAGTAWPPGHSLWLALGYILVGEPGLYQTTPLLGLLVLGVLWLLSLELLPARLMPEGLSPYARYWVAGLAVLILATARQQVEWLTVAMSDPSAQLWGLLVLLFALRSRRKQSWIEAGLAGLCLGTAFAMRYTQVLLALPALYLLLLPLDRAWLTLKRILAFGLGAGLAALPTLAYYTVAFGSPFTTGSKEIGHFAGTNILPNLLQTGAGLFSGPEFLWLLPFIAWGIITQWRVDRHKLIGLGLAVLVVVAFHLPYKLLSIRHLLFIFPLLAFWSAYGFASLLAVMQRTVSSGSRLRVANNLTIILLLTFLLLRGQSTLFLAGDPYFATYGYVTPEQRESFDHLAILTPPQAIIATSLNGGAIVLYTGRTIVRPGDWSTADWLTFVAKIKETGRPLYLLVDGVKMEGPLVALETHYPLRQEATLPLTYFFLDGTGVFTSVPLYQVQFER